jgi:hypothetical protein
MAQNREAERQAAEIRLRAERRIGQLLTELAKAKGAPGNQYTGPLERPEGSKTLQAEQFEADLADPMWQPTTTGLIARQEARERPPVVLKVDDEALWLWGRLQEFERRGSHDLAAPVVDRDEPRLQRRRFGLWCTHQRLEQTPGGTDPWPEGGNA